ncbi:MAG: cell division protein ZapA [Alphaproteobacteria bacterium]
MPEVIVEIGSRSYGVACNDGEESQLLEAAKLLDVEAQTLLSQIGRVPEVRMLLMAGLMLSDRFKEMEWNVNSAEERVKTLESQLRAAETRMASMASAAPKAFPNEDVLMRSYEDAVLRLEELAVELEAK